MGHSWATRHPTCEPLSTFCGSRAAFRLFSAVRPREGRRAVTLKNLEFFSKHVECQRSVPMSFTQTPSYFEASSHPKLPLTEHSSSQRVRNFRNVDLPSSRVVAASLTAIEACSVRVLSLAQGQTFGKEKLFEYVQLPDPPTKLVLIQWVMEPKVWSEKQQKRTARLGPLTLKILK